MGGSTSDQRGNSPSKLILDTKLASKRLANEAGSISTSWPIMTCLFSERHGQGSRSCCAITVMRDKERSKSGVYRKNRTWRERCGKPFSWGSYFKAIVAGVKLLEDGKCIWFIFLWNSFWAKRLGCLKTKRCWDHCNMFESLPLWKTLETRQNFASGAIMNDSAW